MATARLALARDWHQGAGWRWLCLAAAAASLFPVPPAAKRGAGGKQEAEAKRDGGEALELGLRARLTLLSGATREDKAAQPPPGPRRGGCSVPGSRPQGRASQRILPVRRMPCVLAQHGRLRGPGLLGAGPGSVPSGAPGLASGSREAGGGCSARRRWCRAGSPSEPGGLQPETWAPSPGARPAPRPGAGAPVWPLPRSQRVARAAALLTRTRSRVRQLLFPLGQCGCSSVARRGASRALPALGALLRRVPCDPAPCPGPGSAAQGSACGTAHPALARRRLAGPTRRTSASGPLCQAKGAKNERRKQVAGEAPGRASGDLGARQCPGEPRGGTSPGLSPRRGCRSTPPRGARPPAPGSFSLQVVLPSRQEWRFPSFGAKPGLAQPSGAVYSSPR